MLLLSLTGITIYNTLAYHGLEYTTAINGLLMQSSAPLMIGLWSLVLFRDRLTPAQLLGILMSLSGVLVIIAHGDLAALAGLTLNPGDVWFLVAMVSYALYAALLRRRPAIHFLSFLAFTIIAGAIMLLPVTAWEFLAGRRIDPTPAAFAVLAYVVVFPSLLAYIFFNRGVELIGANRAGPFFHLIPGLRLGDRDPVPRRAPAALPRRRLRADHRRHRRRPEGRAANAALERSAASPGPRLPASSTCSSTSSLIASSTSISAMASSPGAARPRLKVAMLTFSEPSSVPSRPMKPGLSLLVM